MQSASFTFNLAGKQSKSPQSIFHQGQGFFLAGSRCLLSIDVGPGIAQCLVSPGVVNLCLAMELFLKSMMLAGGSDPAKTHKLIELFEAIGKAEKDLIRAEYEKSVQVPDFDQLVTAINNFFVEIRYGYEFGVFSLNEFAVYSLARVLYLRSATLHGVKTGIEAVQL